MPLATQKRHKACNLYYTNVFIYDTIDYVMEAQSVSKK